MAERPETKRIVVIDLAFIGDVILATPVTRALKEAYPGAHLAMMTIPLTAPVAAMNPYVDEVIPYDKRGNDRGVPGMWRAAKRLRQRGFDLAVCMNFALRGAVVARMAGIPHRLGYDAQHAGLFLNIVASSQRQGIRHETLNHLEVLMPLGIGTEDTSLILTPPDEARESLAAKRAAHHIPERGYLALCPLGSYERKDLTLTTAAHLVRHFSQRRPIFLIGGPAERDRLMEIARLAGLPPANVLGGDLTLPELAVFLAGADCLITVDTGPLHVAQAVGCRTVAVFGPTDPVVWGPRGEHDTILYHQPGCSPCWGRGKCQHSYACVGNTTARDIIRAVEEETP
ncbi:MAG: glycosyltransferase family 9 protein [Schwartzia sp.]|nr:glycosyltransferase family 9 protein [Schwartzia sp. (in: firmicutes)]